MGLECCVVGCGSVGNMEEQGGEGLCQSSRERRMDSQLPFLHSQGPVSRTETLTLGTHSTTRFSMSLGQCRTPGTCLSLSTAEL